MEFHKSTVSGQVAQAEQNLEDAKAATAKQKKKLESLQKETKAAKTIALTVQDLSLIHIYDCQCQEIQSGALQQHHQLSRTAGVGIHGSGSHCTTSYKWVLRRFAVYVRTGGMAAGRVNPITGTYVRSKRA